MPKPYISHEKATIQSLKRDPRLATEYLNAVLEDGTREELLLARRRLEFSGSMSRETIDRITPESEKL